MQTWMSEAIRAKMTAVKRMPKETKEDAFRRFLAKQDVIMEFMLLWGATKEEVDAAWRLA